MLWRNVNYSHSEPSNKDFGSSLSDILRSHSGSLTLDLKLFLSILGVEILLKLSLIHDWLLSGLGSRLLWLLIVSISDWFLLLGGGLSLDLSKLLSQLLDALPGDLLGFSIDGLFGGNNSDKEHGDGGNSHYFTFYLFDKVYSPL